MKSEMSKQMVIKSIDCWLASSQGKSTNGTTIKRITFEIFDCNSFCDVLRKFIMVPGLIQLDLLDGNSVGDEINSLSSVFDPDPLFVCVFCIEL